VRAGRDVALALDVAASEFFDDKQALRAEGEDRAYDQRACGFYEWLCHQVPHRLVEDGMAEDDWEGWGATGCWAARCGW
jgi:enolase